MSAIVETIIPEISDAEMLELLNTTKPLMMVPDLGLYYIYIKDWSVEHLRKRSFIWDKKNGGKVRRPLKLKESIPTLHTWATPVYFKPTISEVLAQLTLEQRQWCRGFVIEENLSSAHVMRNGYHRSTTHLYGL